MPQFGLHSALHCGPHLVSKFVKDFGVFSLIHKIYQNVVIIITTHFSDKRPCYKYVKPCTLLNYYRRNISISKYTSGNILHLRGVFSSNPDQPCNELHDILWGAFQRRTWRLTFEIQQPTPSQPPYIQPPPRLSISNGIFLMEIQILHAVLHAVSAPRQRLKQIMGNSSYLENWQLYLAKNYAWFYLWPQAPASNIMLSAFFVNIHLLVFYSN